MSPVRCNCENLDCKHCNHHGCKDVPTGRRALYIGPICDGCALYMPLEYIIPDNKEN